MTGEPANGSYVAVKVRRPRDEVRLMERDDAYANRKGRPDQPWIGLHGDSYTWAEVCQLGPVAYVGAFVDRS